MGGGRNCMMWILNLIIIALILFAITWIIAEIDSAKVIKEIKKEREEMGISDLDIKFANALSTGMTGFRKHF